MARKAVTTAMILAAGRGNRMRPLTDHTPKPLLEVAGKPLIVWHLEKLAKAGFEHVVINHAHLGEQIVTALGDGSQFGLKISYSAEQPGGLETAGGIIKALPLLGDGSFLVVNGDVWCDAPFTGLFELEESCLAELLLVTNPAHNLNGDFSLLGAHVVLKDEVVPTYTYAGVGLYSSKLFEGLSVEVRPLAPLLRQAITAHRVRGRIHRGEWCDVGTPERLELLNQQQEID